MDMGNRPDQRAVVLVHGMWGVPEDWRWVQELLEARCARVAVPDLPSHRLLGAGLTEDVDEVKRAIRAFGRVDVIVAGWSYGCDVVGVAAAGEPNVARLLYVSSVPQLRQTETRDDTTFDNDPAFVWDDQGRFAPLGGWWNNDPAMSASSRAHFESHPRRPVGKRTLSDPISAAAWEHSPTTVLLGNLDPFNGEQNRALARQRAADVRVVECGHFIPFSLPGLVAEAILERSGC